MLGVVGDYGSARYTASTGSTTTGTSGGTSSGGASGGAVRHVRLARPPAGSTGPCTPPTFGFSVRGGREHSTGFFVSHIEPSSEAFSQGLKVGDQVVRVNGFRVGDALHKELLSLISGLNYLKLKVRNVGMIPVKDKPSDPLTWRMIPEPVIYSDVMQRTSPPLINMSKDDKVKDVRLTLFVPSRSKLGCGICKGPDWRPGIFVQFTKDNGIAKESGLRPGDQIIQCNGIDFRDIQFSDAVSLMKQAKRLDLWVRTGTGLDLFPGESSGYNSSASSATGDQSPSSADHKRLSIVKEETLDLEDRLSQLDGRYKKKNWDHKNFEWERQSAIKESDSESANEYCDPQKSVHVHKSIYRNFDNELVPQNRTIINLSENGTTIQTNYVLPTVDNSAAMHENKPTFVASPAIDKKTIVVDVHRSESEFRESNKQNVTNIECQNENLKPLKKVPSNSSIVSLANSTTSSLSNAITQELQRRSQRTKESSFSISQMEDLKKNKILKGVDDEKKHKHDALMDEFKKAHRKMFSGGAVDDDVDVSSKSDDASLNKSSSEESRDTITKPSNDRQINNYSRVSTLPRDNVSPNKTNGISPTDLPKRNLKPPDQPPPPPPMPANEKSTKQEQPVIKTAVTHTKPRAPPPPPLKKFLTNGIHNGHQPEKPPDKPPTTPTPDYDTSNVLIKVANKPPVVKQKLDAVEMESLESFKLNNPSAIAPKPPSTYFMKQQNGTLTMKKASQQISVTIGEYPTNTFRKQPSKLGFLNGDTVDSKNSNNEPMGSRLQSELAQMLSRSNLKKKTESDNKLTNHDSAAMKISENPFDLESSDEPNANFNKRYGHIMLPQAPTISIPKVPIAKSLSHNITLNNANDSNSFASQILNGKQELTKTESLPQNGILKNSTPMFINDRNVPLKLGIQHKSIKFRQTTTVIGEPEPLIVNN